MAARTMFNMQFYIVVICCDYRLGSLFYSEPFIQKMSYSDFEFTPH